MEMTPTARDISEQIRKLAIDMSSAVAVRDAAVAESAEVYGEVVRLRDRVRELEAENKERAETNSLLRRQLFCMGEVVEDLVPEGQRLELFAAKVREGGAVGNWTSPLAPLVLGEMDRLAAANAALEAERDGLRAEVAARDATIERFESFAEAHRIWRGLDPESPAAIKLSTVDRLRNEAAGRGGDGGSED